MSVWTICFQQSLLLVRIISLVRTRTGRSSYIVLKRSPKRRLSVKGACRLLRRQTGHNALPLQTREVASSTCKLVNCHVILLMTFEKKSKHKIRTSSGRRKTGDIHFVQTQSLRASKAKRISSDGHHCKRRYPKKIKLRLGLFCERLYFPAAELYTH